MKGYAIMPVSGTCEETGRGWGAVSSAASDPVSVLQMSLHIQGVGAMVEVVRQRNGRAVASVFVTRPMREVTERENSNATAYKMSETRCSKLQCCVQ